MMYGQGIMNGFSSMSPFMLLFMILLWGFAIIGLFFLTKWLVSLGRPELTKADSPHGILAKRYARGEITQVEFEKMKNDLR
jgi:uncharacterized membrane protein